MGSWIDAQVERQIRQAQERGEFDDLPGSGEPLPGRGEAYDENWWLKRLIEREGIRGAVPPAIALHREVEDIAGTVAAKPSEAAVREYVADLNSRIHRARRGPVLGPPVTVAPVDVERVAADWRARRRPAG